MGGLVTTGGEEADLLHMSSASLGGEKTRMRAVMPVGGRVEYGPGDHGVRVINRDTKLLGVFLPKPKVLLGGVCLRPPFPIFYSSLSLAV